MAVNLRRTVEPIEEPITLAQAKAQCHIDHDDEDAYLLDLIKAAREWGESVTDRAFVTQTWELRLPYFSDCEGWIELPKPPLASVTSIKYLDSSGVEVTWSATEYIVTGIDTESSRGCIEPAYGYLYPVTYRVPDAVRIIFVAGYGTALEVPQGIKNALLYHVAEAYGNRERPDYSLAENTIWPWKRLKFA